MISTALPYAGTSGHTGSDTSRARARTMDASGATRTLQHTAIKMLRRFKGKGLTSGEFGEHMAVHHGTASGTMTALHMAGKVARLTEKRDGRKVYVLPEWVRDRETEEVGRTAKTILMEDMVDYLSALDDDEAWRLIDRFEQLVRR